MLLRHKEIGRQIVPIIPDEARTFGLDALFREIGIYSSKGQLYEPVDSKTLLYYHEAKDGQILEEGITEAGSMASFIAAGTAYANRRINMVPFYIYYSMFGFQRIGDLMWLAGDNQGQRFSARRDLRPHHPQWRRAATSGRPQPAACEHHSDLADLRSGFRLRNRGHHRRRYAAACTPRVRNFSITSRSTTRITPCRRCRRGWRKAFSKGFISSSRRRKGKKLKAHIFGSGPILSEALRAQEILAEQFDVSADVWSATSYKLLRNDALRTQRWNMLHPTATPRKSYLESVLAGRRRRVRRGVGQYEDRRRPDRALGAGRID